MKKHHLSQLTILLCLPLLLLTACNNTRTATFNKPLQIEYDSLTLNLKQVGEHVTAKFNIRRQNLPHLPKINFPPSKLKLTATTASGPRTPDETPGAFTVKPYRNYINAHAVYLFKDIKKQDFKDVKINYGRSLLTFTQTEE